MFGKKTIDTASKKTEKIGFNLKELTKKLTKRSSESEISKAEAAKKSTSKKAELIAELTKKLTQKTQQKKLKSPQRNIAVFVDGPNILRKEFNISLSDIKEVLANFGKIKIGKVFLNQYASDKLIEAVVNQGFESVVTVGDIDVSMATDAVEAIFNPHINSIALVTRDADFLPAIIKAKRYGKETIVLLADEASAAALKNNADHVVILKKKNNVK